MKDHRSQFSMPFRAWLVILSLLLFVPLFVAMLVVNANTGNLMREQSVTFNEDTLTLHLDRIDSNILSMERLLVMYPNTNYAVSALQFSKNENARYMAATDILTEIGNYIVTYEAFDGMFVYSESPIRNEFLCKYGVSTSASQSLDIRGYIESNDLENIAINGWSLIQVGRMNYIFRVVQSGGTYCGAWIEASTILRPLDKAGFGVEGSAAISDVHTGTRLAQIGELAEGETYLQTSKNSGIAPFSITAYVPEKKISAYIRSAQTVFLLVFGAVLCLIPIIWYLLDKKIGAEFYARQIREQKTRLQFLHLQIKPHFFLNTMNVIRSFALIKRFDLIEKMTICMVKHFRYVFHNTDSMVTLGEEIRHIENYMEIQELRYPGNFVFELAVDETLADVKIPTLIIQTFIENSIKYALDIERSHTISLRAERVDDGYLKITVSDNGPGYSPETLDVLSAGHALDVDETQNIGINNAKQRLKLIYGNAARIDIYNAEDGGAATDILIKEGAN